MSDSSLPDSSLPAAKSRPAQMSQRVSGTILRLNRSSSVDQGLGQGMEIAMAMGLFLGLGWLVDSWLGTQPIFTIVLTLLATVGTFAKIWFSYQERMRILEAERRQGTAAQQSAEEAPR
jgi:F0F1-type ATP synthase assembly protein I